MFMVWMYVAYVFISVALTVWVGRTLYKNGRIFLVDSTGGNETLADSINRLLLIGFYLINVGFMTLTLQEKTSAEDVRQVIEFLSRKVGFVLVVLGGMHFLNLFIFSKLRKDALRKKDVVVAEEVVVVPNRPTVPPAHPSAFRMGETYR